MHFHFWTAIESIVLFIFALRFLYFTPCTKLCIINNLIEKIEIELAFPVVRMLMSSVKTKATRLRICTGAPYLEREDDSNPVVNSSQSTRVQSCDATTHRKKMVYYLQHTLYLFVLDSPCMTTPASRRTHGTRLGVISFRVCAMWLGLGSFSLTDG